MGMEYAGEKNTNGYKQFRFACPDPKCKGKGTFHAVWENAPDLVPSGMPCPFGGEHEAEWIVDSGPNFHTPGKSSGMENPHYSKALADSEHRWMELQIEEAKKAVNAQDQIDGTAASPYSKVSPNYDAMERDGLVHRDDEKVAEQKARTRAERAKKVAEQAADKIDREIERKHIGRRHDG